MNKTLNIFFILATLIFAPLSLANGKGVAKAIILKGKVLAKSDGETKVLSKNDWVEEGTAIHTKKGSFVKFLFIDRSQLLVKPNSVAKITKFPKEKAGIITLLKGKIRSKVTKDYMKMDKNKSKLFIKTKTAAMGVRGTDFHVSYSPENNNTSIITFEGSVAFNQIDIDQKIGDSQAKLEKVVNAPTRVMVTQGQFSVVTPNKANRPTIPTKLNKGQLDSLEKSDPTVRKPTKETKEVTNNKAFKAPIPPGVNSKEFANTESSLDKEFSKTIGLQNVQNIKEVAISAFAINTPPPEGFKDNETGAYAPPAGGYIDLATSQYIAPPPGSAFDPITETYIPPAQYGTYDPSTGDYKNDLYELTANSEFKLKETEIDGRAPASDSQDSNLPPPPPLIEGTISEDGQLDQTIDSDLPPPPTAEFNPEEFDQDREEQIDETQQQIIDNKAKAIFIINSN